MEKIKNALGKKIQISNSPEGISLYNKQDFLTNLDFETLLLKMGNICSTFSGKIKYDDDISSVYTSLYILGHIDGGKLALDYFNSKIPPEYKITSNDIMLYNLKKIFPNLEQEFSQEELDTASELFSSKTFNNEVIIVKISYYLEYIAQGLVRIGKFDTINATNYIFSEISKIIDNYYKTSVVDITPQMREYMKMISSQAPQLDESKKQELDNIADNYMTSLNKTETIEKLVDLKFEKKNEMRK